MAYSLPCVSFSSILLFFFLFISLSFAQQHKVLVIPVSKDFSTRQYVTKVNQRTPLVPINLVLDLGGQFLWVDCEQNYTSSTYRPARCGSAQCSLAKANGCGDCFSPPRPGCNNNTCGVSPDNTITHTATGGEVTSDVLAIQSTDGSNPGRVATVKHFIFSCAPNSLLDPDLADGVVGFAGLGRTKIGLPLQLAAAFSFPRKFAICLPSSQNSKGVVLFGDEPYNFLPNIDASKSLTYTPLLINPVSTASAFTQGERSSEYFIGVTSIRIDDKVVPVNRTLFSIDSKGNGGTKISTVNSVTLLETSIYNAVTEAFINACAARNITRVESPEYARYDVCFDSKDLRSTRLGPSVPTIELVLQNESTVWRIFGANSMVYIDEKYTCLLIGNAGSNPRTSIVIGGYQLEDNLLQFDLERSRLGFSSTLLGRQTTCSNFNFTSTA